MVFFFYQLIVIVIFANGTSLLGRKIAKYFTPYANAIGLNTSWNFFSPDPAHTMSIKYETRYEDVQGNEIKPSQIDYFPPEKNQIAKTGVSRRFLYSMRFYVLDQKKLKLFFAPWLCRKHPEASSVKIQFDFYKIPPIDYYEGVSDGMTLNESLEQIKYFEIVYNCHQTQDEVAL